CEFEGEKIQGESQVVYLSNLLREEKSAPKRRESIINHFVETLSRPETEELGLEVWSEIRGNILPVLKPRDYVEKDGPTRHFVVTEWLSDVLICYVIRSKNMFRFVTGWDVERWELTPDLLHAEALKNLAQLPWPRQLMGSAAREG